MKNIKLKIAAGAILSTVFISSAISTVKFAEIYNPNLSAIDRFSFKLFCKVSSFLPVDNSKCYTVQDNSDLYIQNESSLKNNIENNTNTNKEESEIKTIKDNYNRLYTYVQNLNTQSTKTVYQVIERAVPGPKGDKGDTGISGQDGIVGTIGMGSSNYGVPVNGWVGGNYTVMSSGSGSVGATGATGPQGPAGPAGAAGANGTTTIITNTTITVSTSTGDITATGTASLANIIASTTNTNILNASTTNTDNLTFTNGTGTNLVTTNATSTNFFSNLLTAVSGYFTNLFTQNLTASTTNTNTLTTTGTTTLAGPNILQGTTTIDNLVLGSTAISNIANQVASNTTNILDYSTSTNVLTSTVNGKVATTSIVSGGSALKYYAESLTGPSAAPLATGLESVAIGNAALASGENSIAIGIGDSKISNTASGDFSTAIGFINRISGPYSMGIGSFNMILSTNSFAFGKGNTLSADNTFGFGSVDNTIPDSLMIGPNDMSKITILGSTGKEGWTGIGLGNSTPNNQLEVYSQNGANGMSGLRLTNLTSTSTPATSTNQFLTVDENGDVVLASADVTPNTTSVITASNGLNMGGDDVRLGGNLSTDTNIFNSGFNLNFVGNSASSTMGLSGDFTQTSTSTTMNMFNITNTGAYTGTGLWNLNANSLTTGTAANINVNGMTTGTGLKISSSFINTTGNLLLVQSSSMQNSANGIVRFNFAGHGLNGVQLDDLTTSGNAMAINVNSLTNGTGLNISGTNVSTFGNLLRVSSASTGAFTNGAIRLNMTGAHTGSAFQIDTPTVNGSAQTINATGAYTGTGLWNLNANSLTTGTAANISVNALTSGTGLKILSTASASTGNLLRIDTTAQTSNVAYINANGARSSGAALFINTTPNANGGATTASGIQINMPAAASLLNLRYLRFANSAGTEIGSITNPSTSAIAYNTTSDGRLKLNQTETHYTLEDLLKIKVHDFNWITDGSSDTGFIAQDLYNIYPLAVTKGDNGTDAYVAGETNTWSIDYGKVTPLIVKSIQELNTKVNIIASSTLNLASASTTNILSGNTGIQNMGGNALINVKSITSSNSSWSIDENGRIRAKEICLGNTCVDENALKNVLGSYQLNPVNTNPQTEAPAPEAPTDTETPAIETPAPAPVTEIPSPAPVAEAPITEAPSI